MSSNQSSASSRPLVLVVEDEVPMRKFLQAFLSGAGYRSEEAATGEEALRRAVQEPPDVVILDLGLPDMDGQEVLQRLREWLKAPIIVLSVRNKDSQKIAALDHGANDYLTKPFSTGELLARIRVALRYTTPQQQSTEPVYEFRGLKVDLPARRVFVEGVEVRLTPIEYKLLSVLVQHAGKVTTHQFLLEAVWGPQQALSKQHLRVFMAGLRRKIEADPAQPQYLITELGIGYRLAGD